MSQTFTDDVFAGGHVAATDMQNIENNFAALKSMFSGASQPANAVSGMPWFDTTKKVMKHRNYGDSAWLGLMHGDTSQKIFVYRNAAIDGWAIDSSPTDRVLALKGGSTYTTGGANAGSWDTSHTHPDTFGFSGNAHNHQWHDYISTGSDGYTWNSGGSPISEDQSVTPGSNCRMVGLAGNGSGPAMGVDGWTSNVTPTGTITGSVSSGSISNFRPAAAVGTLQYLDL